MTIGIMALYERHLLSTSRIDPYHQRLGIQGQGGCINRPVRLTLIFLVITFFNWRIIALQCCFGFCSTTMRISYMYTPTPPSGASLPSPRSYASKSSQSTKLGSPCHAAASHQLAILHMVVSSHYFFTIHYPQPKLLCYVNSSQIYYLFV